MASVTYPAPPNSGVHGAVLAQAAIALVDQAGAVAALERIELVEQHGLEADRHRVRIAMRAAERLAHDLVDQAEFEQARRGDAERLGGVLAPFLYFSTKSTRSLRA